MIFAFFVSLLKLCPKTSQSNKKNVFYEYRSYNIIPNNDKALIAISDKKYKILTPIPP